MKSVVILWILILVVLLGLTIANKDHTSQTQATVLETDCLNVKGANPCDVKVKYKVNGIEYVEKLSVKPSEQTLVGKDINIRYNHRLPNQIREYSRSMNIYAIPTIIWFLLGLCILYFMYT